MIPEGDSRTARLLGTEAITRLATAKVAVYGLGGVGSYAVEALVRSGIGKLTLVDMDIVAPSDLNRQLQALVSTIGLNKADVLAKRATDINPSCLAEPRVVRYLPGDPENTLLPRPDAVVDAMDTVNAKLDLIERCIKMGIPIISSMGTGNKLDPTAFRLGDISETAVCPLARVMRRELKKRGILHLPVVWSEEPPVRSSDAFPEHGRILPGSVSFVPGAAGLALASWVVKTLLQI